MQEFCPLCTKNGIQSKIRALQLNYEEAVFMCPHEECPWPIGYEELVFIDRPALGKDLTKDWDQIESEYLKKEQSDPLFEFTAYTPPQTPGTEVFGKDVTLTVPQKVINPVCKEDSVNIANNFFTDSTQDNNNFEHSVKPKLKSISKPLNYNVQRLPTRKGFVLKKNSDNNPFFSNKIISNTKVNSNFTLDTSINNNSSFIHKWVHDSAIANKVAEKPKENTILSSKKRFKKIIPTEFNFDEAKKSKSTNLGKVQVENKKPSNTSTCDNTVKTCKLIRVKVEKDKKSSVIKEFDFNTFNSNKVLDPILKNNSVHYIKSDNQNESEITGFNLDEFINQHCASNCNQSLIDVKHSVQVNNNSVDSDCTLALSTSTLKDSGVDQDLLDLDVSLDGFLTDLDYFSPENQLLKNENMDTQDSSKENSIADNKFNNELSNSEADFIESLYS